MKKTKRNNKIVVKYTKSKKIKKNNSRKIKKNNSRKIKRGGEFLSAGSFGAVYANPRLLCESTKTQKKETLETPGIYDEVSKLFENDNDAIDELNNIDNLYTGLGKDFYEFGKYAIMPKKICRLNLNSLRENPYNTEEWMKNKENRYNKKIFKVLHEIHDYHNNTSRKIFKTPMDYKSDYNKYNFIITSDKGGYNLNKLFASVDSDFIFKYFLKEIISIVKGIKIMHSKGFIHSDLKSSNCIAHQYTFKIIDLAGNENIETIKKVGKYSDFGYLYWPHTVVYTDFFKNPDVKLENIVMTNGLLSEKFNKYYDRNISNYTKFPNYLESSFDIDREYGFTEEEIKKVNKIKEDLYFQKTFNITYPYVYSDKENIKKRIIQTLHNPNPNYRSTFLTDFNTIFQNFENIESLKMDIFKRIDIYGIGTIIMECIYSYLYYIEKKDTNIDIYIREIIIKLYEIIYDCCYQGERVANIDEIIEKYENIVYYFNIDLFEKTLSEKGVLNEFKQYAIIPSKNDNQTVEKIIDNYKNEEKTLDLILKKINSYDDFKNYLKKITSIAKGIQIIYNSGFINLIDINMKNCIEDNDTFKIVVSDKVIPYNYTNNSMFTTKLSSYFVYDSKILKNYFNLENKGFSPEEVSEINEMALDIIESFSIIDKKIEIEQSFYNTNRIDIYCFGIIILDCIYNYLNKQGTQSVPTANSNDIDENIRNAIKQLYLIVYKCCYQSRDIANIDEIISEYENICDKLLNNDYVFSELKLPSPPLPPPSSSPSMPRFIAKI